MTKLKALKVYHRTLMLLKPVKELAITLTLADLDLIRNADLSVKSVKCQKGLHGRPGFHLRGEARS